MGTRKQVKVLFNQDRTRKVVIFKRENGSFGFDELKFAAEEKCWFPVGRYSEAFVDSLENALREASARVVWLAQEENEPS